jgi:hypothetical protein
MPSGTMDVPGLYGLPAIVNVQVSLDRRVRKPLPSRCQFCHRIPVFSDDASASPSAGIWTGSLTDFRHAFRLLWKSSASPQPQLFRRTRPAYGRADARERNQEWGRQELLKESLKKLHTGVEYFNGAPALPNPLRVLLTDTCATCGHTTLRRSSTESRSLRTPAAHAVAAL